MQLNPGQKYATVWQADNQADTGTYYPQAIVRISNIGKIWAIVDLTPDPNGVPQRYLGYYTTPTDGGSGVQIDITISVYEDANHTILSSVYATVNRDYMVSLLFSPSIGFSSGSDGLNADDIDKIVRAALDGRPMPKGVQVEDIGEEFKNKLIPMLNQHNEFFKNINSRFNEIGKVIDKIKSSNGRISSGVKKNIGSSSEDIKNNLDSYSFGIKEELKEYFIEMLDKKLNYSMANFKSEIDRLIKHLETAYTEELPKKFKKTKQEEEKERLMQIEDLSAKVKDFLLNSKGQDYGQSEARRFAKKLLNV